MLKSDEIFQIIKMIAATPSKNEKLAMVKSHIGDGAFKLVLEHTYSPFKTYYLAKRPALTGSHGEGQFSFSTWAILDDLIARRLSGNAAIEAVAQEMQQLTADSAELLWRIIKKDLRADFSESTINKACPGLIQEFPYMRCCLPKDAKLDQFDWESGVFSQEKADGMFANLDISVSGDVQITSRQGSPFPSDKFSSLLNDARHFLPGTQLHGELLVEKSGKVQPREISNGMLTSVMKGGDFESDEVPVYLIWDQIPLSSVKPKGKCETAYAIRLDTIREQLEKKGNGAIRLIGTRVCHSLSDAYNHYRDMLEMGKEGTIIKNRHAIWRDGTSKEQVKLKLEADIDLKIVDILKGKADGKNEGRAGSFRCHTSCGKLRVDVTVKNEKLRDLVDAAPHDFINRVIVVRANSIMPPSGSNEDYSLFLPRMVESSYRLDKSEPDSLARVIQQFEAAAGAAVVSLP